MSIFHSRRRVFGATLAALLVASFVSFTTLADPASAAFAEGPCQATEGVTVVVDFGAFGGEPVARCALGLQATGMAALQAAFTTSWVPGFEGTGVCTVDGFPSDGFPTCWEGGFWAYWHPDGDAWGFAPTGAHLSQPAPGAVEGWSFGFAPDFNAVAPSIGPVFVPSETTTTTAPTNPTGPGAGAAAAAAWLNGELAGGFIPGFLGTADWGLTADAVLALAAAGMGDAPNAQLATQTLVDNIASFATFDDFAMPGVRLAGPLAKLLLVFAVQGEDVNDVGGWDIEAELRDVMLSDGHFADGNPFDADLSNSFGQSFAILGLDRTPGGVPAEAIQFMLAQQCPDGGFRLFYVVPGSGCASDSDATGLAVQALLVVDRTPTVNDALLAAIEWLLARQDASGAWGGTGPTAAINTNSTGIIAPALRAAGQIAAADRAAAYVLSLQLGGTAAALAAFAVAAVVPADGAIAYDSAAFSAAVAQGGIDEIALDQFRRTTAQAVFALGLPSYGAINRQTPDPVTTTSTSTTTTTVATATSTTASVVAPTTLAAAGSTVPPTAVAVAAANDDSGALPFTGSGLLAVLVFLGAGLLGAGALVGGTRRRVVR
jgi:hypothetical protein